ncbi:MAG: hypothetical protein Kow0042_03390 [Calditrichia bacterium]
MIPIKIQHVQLGALSADKTFQSLKQLPQNNQRIFEAEISRQMEEARERTEAAEKSEKSRIDERNQKKNRKEEEKKSKQKEEQLQAEKAKEKQLHQFIEKEADGTIKHIDVKV